MASFGKKISQHRKGKKLTQKQFAKLAEITYRHYQDIEGDKANIRLSTAMSIASVLQIPIQSLFDQNHSLEISSAGIDESWQILEKIPMGICLTNLEGKILYLNKFFKTKLLEKNEVDKNQSLFVWDLLPQDKKKEGRLDFLRILREQPKPRPSNRIYVGPEKKPIQVSIFWDYVHDATGDLKGFVSGVMPIEE